jgi:hypothetical protein
MMRLPRLLGGFALGTAVVATSLPARADVQACLAASEQGQHARAAGKLREARAQFNICGAESCPGIVRRDCVQWQQELVALLPSVVFGARDASGRDLFDVTVSMDGEVLTKKLDGKSVFIDPGPHTFTFEAAGTPAVTVKALVKEGEKARVINVTIGASGAQAGAGAPPNGAQQSGAQQPGGAGQPAPEQPAETREHGPIPWVVVGVGGAAIVAGVVVLLTAPERPSNCDKDTKMCSPRPNEPAADLESDQDRAAKADSQPVVGIGLVAGGALVVAGGLLWHFLEPTGPADGKREARGVRVSPWAAPGSGGLSVRARF